MTPDRPFAPPCTHDAFLETVAAGEALRRFDAGLGAREPFLLLTGEPGTGKTALAHEAVARWGGRVAAAFVAFPALSGPELLEEIALRFGASPPEGARLPRLVACLEQALGEVAARGQVALVVVDDAHRLPATALEELRLLANAAQQAGRPLEVLLAGLPALEALLEDPALAPLRQRVAVRVRLEPLSAGETRRYLRHRMAAAGGDGSAFPRRTCAAIAEACDGVPRRINALAAEALRLAHAAGAAEVSVAQVRQAIASLAGDGPAHVDAAPDEAAEPAAPDAAAPAPDLAALRAAALAHESDEAPHAPAPTHHDPGEWVARFVGDRGPVVIGSQAMAAAPSAWEPVEPGTPAGTDGDEATAEPHAGPASHPRAKHRPHAHRRGRGRALPGRVTTTLLVGCAAVAALVPLIRAGLRARASAPRPAAVATSAPSAATVTRPAEVATSRPPVAVASRPAAPPPAPTASPSGGVPAAGSRSGGASGAMPRAASAPAVGPADPVRAAAAAPVSPTGRWTLEVGAIADLQGAIDERDRLRDLTGLDAWVVPARAGVAEPDRIVLGIYRSHARATAAARMLRDTRTVAAVKVVPLPKRADRR